MNKDEIELKRRKEKEVIYKMIKLYSKKNHDQNNSELLNYALKRIDDCPYIETKTFCSECKTPCYKEDMKEKVQDVMRYAGPRMMIYYPVLTLKHLYLNLKNRNNRTIKDV